MKKKILFLLLATSISIFGHSQKHTSSLSVFSDQFDNGFQNKGWSGVFVKANEEKKSGDYGLKAAYFPEKEWGTMKLVASEPISISDYNYLSFWVKGADTDKKITIFINGASEKTIDVPANVWTFYKIDLKTYIPEVKELNNLSFQMVKTGVTIYFDDIMFNK